MSAGSPTHLSSQSKRSAAHVLRQHGDAAAAQDARDGDAAAAVVAGRRPDGAVAGRIELAGDDARHQAAVGGQDLVGVDHREAVAERQDDAGLHPGQRRGQLDMPGHLDQAGARRIVEPVDAEQIERMRAVGIGIREFPADRRPEWSTDPATGRSSAAPRRLRGSGRASARRPRYRPPCVRAQDAPWRSLC